IRRAELGPASGSRLRVAALIENKVLHPTIEGISDSDALLEPWVVDIVRLRIEDIYKVFVTYGKGDPTWHSELMPCREVLAVLIDNLYSSIRPIAHEDSASLVHRDAVYRRTKLAWRVSGFSPGLDELAILRVLHDAVVRSVAVGDEDIPVRSSHHTGGRAEMVLIISSNSGFSERQQHFSIRAELAHDMPSFNSGFDRCPHCVFRRRIGHPY